jgi:hypothetical protein
MYSIHQCWLLMNQCQHGFLVHLKVGVFLTSSSLRESQNLLVSLILHLLIAAFFYSHLYFSCLASTELKNIACGVLGILLCLEVQRGKEGMKTKEFMPPLEQQQVVQCA